MLTRLAFFTAISLSFAAITNSPSIAGGNDRELLSLNPVEQNAVRSEMRRLLISVSDILLALSEKDMAAVEKSSRKAGMVMVGQVEVSLKKRLTPTFMKLGKSVHVGFDEIADAARNGADRDKIIKLLAEQTNRCTTCHAAYGLK